MLFQTKLIFYDVSLSSGSALMYYPLMESTLANQECCALSLKSCKLFLGEYCTPDARARDRPYTGRGGKGYLSKLSWGCGHFNQKKVIFFASPIQTQTKQQRYSILDQTLHENCFGLLKTSQKGFKFQMLIKSHLLLETWIILITKMKIASSIVFSGILTRVHNTYPRYFRSKWSKSIPRLRPKRLKNHTLFTTHIYIVHVGEYPPRSPYLAKQPSSIWL